MHRVLMLVGARGMLGRDVQDALGEDYEILALDVEDLDITDGEAVRKFVRRHRPDLVVNAAAFTDVDACEKEAERCFLSNAIGARNLAVAAELYGAELVHISTDYVFDGEREGPYFEYDDTAPRGEYATSKRAAEIMVRSICRRHYILRTSVLFGLHGKSFVDAVTSRARRGEDLQVPEGRMGCPTHTWDLAKAIGRVARSQRYGTLHFNQGECMSRADFARSILRAYELGGVEVHEVDPGELSEVAPRPRRLELSMRQWKLEGFPEPRNVEEALRHLRERQDGDNVTQGKSPWKDEDPEKGTHQRKRRGAWVPQREAEEEREASFQARREAEGFTAREEREGGGERPRDRDRDRDRRPRRDDRDRDRGGYRRDNRDNRDNRGGGGYRRDNRDGGGYRRDNRDGGYRRDNRDGGGYRRDNRDGGGYRRDNRDGGGYRRDNRDGGGYRRDNRGGGGYRRDNRDGGGYRRDNRDGGGYRRDDRGGGGYRRDDRGGGGYRRDDRDGPRKDRKPWKRDQEGEVAFRKPGKGGKKSFEGGFRRARKDLPEGEGRPAPDAGSPPPQARESRPPEPPPQDPGSGEE